MKLSVYHLNIFNGYLTLRYSLLTLLTEGFILFYFITKKICTLKYLIKHLNKKFKKIYQQTSFSEYYNVFKSITKHLFTVVVYISFGNKKLLSWHK